MSKFDINEARRIRTEKAIAKNWNKFRAWAEQNPDRILVDEESGQSYAPENFAQFREQWLSMDGSNKLQRIKYDSQYKSSYKTAIAMRKKLLESDPTADITLEKAKKTGTYEFREKYLNPSIEKFQKAEFARMEREYKERLGVENLGPSIVADIKRQIGKKITFEFFGGS